MKHLLKALSLTTGLCALAVVTPAKAERSQSPAAAWDKICEETIVALRTVELKSYCAAVRAAESAAAARLAALEAESAREATMANEWESASEIWRATERAAETAWRAVERAARMEARAQSRRDGIAEKGLN